MSRGQLLYEGKSKQVWSSDDPSEVILVFKDDATAFNGVKHALIDGKARVNGRISERLFAAVAEAGVPHHLREVLSDTEWRCDRVSVIPVEVVVRNVVAGSLAKRYGREEGEALAEPLVEYFYKSDALNDPLMGADVAFAFGWVTPDQLSEMKAQALVVNRVLCELWGSLGIDLIDFKLEFGTTHDGRLVLADELSPDGSRLWEQGTGRKLDKDVFRRDLGDLSATYREVYRRLLGHDLEDA